MTRNPTLRPRRNAYEILEFKAKILRIAVSSAGGFVVLILLYGLFGGVR